VEEYGQLGRKCANVYYQYGNALLEQAEAQADLFGQVLQKEDQAQAQDDSAELLEISWECLETSRIVLSKFSDQATKEEKMLLSRVHQRLGDHLNETGNFLEASKEYRKCLSIRESFLESNDRLLADAHFTLGESLRHAKQIDKALEHYKHAHKIIQSCLDSYKKTTTTTTTTSKAEDEKKENDRPRNSSTSDEDEKKMLRSILLDIQAKIDEFEKKETKIEKKMGGSTTTIGFGGSSSSSGSMAVTSTTAPPATTVGFGGLAKKRALEASANVLSVRTVKKAKVEDEEGESKKVA